MPPYYDLIFGRKKVEEKQIDSPQGQLDRTHTLFSWQTPLAGWGTVMFCSKHPLAGWGTVMFCSKHPLAGWGTVMLCSKHPLAG